MIKLTKDSISGNLVINPNSKTFGRSAYLCYNQNCIEKALKKNKLKHALRTNATIEKEQLCSLLEENTTVAKKGTLDEQFKS
jgi:predicted RNA-binding protein YlxR (DUF448 family)